MNVRSRFAPSPTGYIHLGGIRTALFAFLLAKHSDGQFILRLEDTDKSREVEGAKEHIIKCLKVLGIEYDEGPDIGGNFGPYIQSDRLGIYKDWAKKLIDSGRAYTDPYTKQEIEQFRNQTKASKSPFLYRNFRPENPPTWQEGMPLRFKSDPKAYKWNDLVMGELSFSSESIDDFILIKSDGYPTYNFAHIIDDHLMEISHVLRGQEFMSSVPNYLNLHEALEIEHPLYATLPHVLNEQGNKKLSKRDGAKDVLDYIRDGYLPESLVSFIATLGWNDGSTQEIFTQEELISKFSLDRVQRSGAKLDLSRLNWINGTLIRQMDPSELYSKIKDFFPEESSSYSDDYKLEVTKVIQERLKYFSEVSDLSIFFFKDLPVDLSLIQNNKQLKKFSFEDLKDLLFKAREVIETSNFSEEDLTDKLNSLLDKTNQKPAVIFSLIRIATTQAPSSPPLSASLKILGKEKTLARIDDQLAHL